MAPRDPALLLRAAELYYVDNRSQAEVAASLGVSRSNVSRILAEAQRQGIVEIRLHDPSGRDRSLERQLVDRFGLVEARVASADGATGRRAESRVGVLAAQLALENLKDEMVVGLSWGRMLQTAVHAVAAERDRDVTVTQLLGGMSALGNETSGQELVRELAVRLGGSYRLLHAPAAMASVEACRALTSDPSISAALGLARRSDVALVGVGDPRMGSSAAVVEAMDLSEQDRAAFWAQEPVGDLAGRYLTVQGQPVRGPVDDRVVAVTLEDLVRIPLLVGIVSGQAKTEAVLGVLRGRYLDALVCDAHLATSLLSRAGGEG